VSLAHLFLGHASQLTMPLFVWFSWMVNRPEWQLVHLAACSYSLPITSLYDTLGPGVVEYCINHAEAKVVFATPNHFPALLELAGSRCPNMKLIVSVDK
jgi:long-chain acyl-CoA synthetase